MAKYVPTAKENVLIRKKLIVRRTRACPLLWTTTVEYEPQTVPLNILDFPNTFLRAGDNGADVRVPVIV